MKRILSMAAALSLFAAVACAQSPQWSVLIPESAITAVTGETTFAAGAMAVNSTGGIALLDRQTTHKILYIEGTTVNLVATAAQMATAIDNANGSATGPTAAQISVQCVDFNDNGYILVYTRNSGATSASDQGTLLAISTTPPYPISVLATTVDTTNSPIGGGMGMTVIGNTCYLFLDDYYYPNAPAEGVYSVDTSTIVNDGSKTATLVFDTAALLAASGDNATNNAINDGVKLDANTIIALNSGVNNSNDNLIKLDLSGTPTASLYVAATDIEADLGASDVGYTGIAADSNGKIYLANAYGAGSTDDGVIILSNIIPPNADATVELEADIATACGGTDLNSIGNDGIVYSGARGGILLSSGGTGMKGVLFFPVPSPVEDWLLY